MKCFNRFKINVLCSFQHLKLGPRESNLKLNGPEQGSPKKFSLDPKRYPRLNFRGRLFSCKEVVGFPISIIDRVRTIIKLLNEYKMCFHQLRLICWDHYINSFPFISRVFCNYHPLAKTTKHQSLFAVR